MLQRHFDPEARLTPLHGFQRIQLLALPLLLLAAAAPVARSGSAEPARLQESVDFLASEACRGRRSGSPGNERARAWLVGRIVALGLEPLAGRDGFSQSFEVAGEALAETRATLIGPARRELRLVLSVGSPLDRNPITRLRLWRHGEPAPACAQGVALVRPGPAGEAEFFSPTDLQIEAAAAGAIGVILIPHPDDASGRYRRYLDRSRNRDPRLYRLKEDESREPFLAYAEPEEAERLFIGDALIETGWRIELPAGAPLALRGENLCGRMPGGGDGGSLLLVAHYDHLGESGSGYFPGADDNASGVATLLETLRLLVGVELDYELRFLFSDSEELGLLGAQAYLAGIGAPDRVINLDSVGRAGVDHYRKLADPDAASEALMIVWNSVGEEAAGEALRAALDAAGFASESGDGAMFARGGDHHVFARSGVPSRFLFGGFHMDYNTENDLPGRILPERLAKLADALVGHLAAGAAMPPPGDSR